MTTRIYADIETIPPDRDKYVSSIGIDCEISDEDFQKLSLQANTEGFFVSE